MKEKTLKTFVHVTQVGRYTVEDATTQALQTEDGEADFTLEELARVERRAARVVLSDIPRVDGPVIRYARKALGLRQTELAVLLDVDVGTLSRWENGHDPFKHSVQLALIALLDEANQHGPAAARERSAALQRDDPPPSTTVLKAS